MMAFPEDVTPQVPDPTRQAVTVKPNNGGLSKPDDPGDAIRKVVDEIAMLQKTMETIARELPIPRFQ